MFEQKTSTPRRVPRQQRSREKLERMLDVADRLLAEEGAEALTTTRVAGEAEVAVGSIYAYFSDRDAIAEALALRHWQRFADLVTGIAEAEEQTATTHPLATIIEALAAGFRSHPSFLTLWYSSLRTEQMRTVTRPVREEVGVSITRVLKVQWPAAPPDVLVKTAEMIVLAGDGILREAFRVNPSGDSELLSEGLVMLESYVDRRLGRSEARLR